MAIKKQVDISVDAKQAISQMDELGSSFEDVFGEIKPLNTKIGEMEDALYQLAAAGDTSSKEFKDLSRTIGDYKKVIIDTDMQVDAMAQTTAQNLGGAIEGLSGVFSIGTGAMAAFGVESEAVGEALLRVQSVMAITQGIQSVREGSKAFRGLKTSIMNTTIVQKGLNAVMKANPIGAIVTVIAALGTAVVALSGGFSNLKEKLTGVTAEQEMMSDVTAKAVDNIIDELAASEKLQSVLEDETINREDKIKAVKDLQEEYPDLLSNIDAEKSSLEGISEALKLNTKLLLLKAKQEAALELQKEKIKDNVREQIEKETGANVKFANSFDAMLKGVVNFGTQGVGAFTDLTNVKKNFNKVTDDEIANNNTQIDAYQNIQEELQTQIGLLEKEAKSIGGVTKAINKKVEAKEKELEIEIEFAELKKREQLEAPDFTDPEGMVEIEAEELKGTKLFEIQQKWRDAGKEADEESWEGRLGMIMKGLGEASNAINTLSALNNAVTDAQLAKANGDEEKMQKIRKRAFERDKKLQLANAIVTGIRSTLGAFADGVTKGGPVLGAIQAAIAAAMSVAQIVKIKNTKFEGGSVGSITPPSGDGGNIPAPQFNVVGNSPQNQLAQSLGQNQSPLKAFVVAGDVTTAQGLERNAIKTASL